MDHVPGMLLVALVIGFFVGLLITYGFHLLDVKSSTEELHSAQEEVGRERVKCEKAHDRLQQAGKENENLRQCISALNIQLAHAIQERDQARESLLTSQERFNEEERKGKELHSRLETIHEQCQRLEFGSKLIQQRLEVACGELGEQCQEECRQHHAVQTIEARCKQLDNDLAAASMLIQEEEKRSADLRVKLEEEQAKQRRTNAWKQHINHLGTILPLLLPSIQLIDHSVETLASRYRDLRAVLAELQQINNASGPIHGKTVVGADRWKELSKISTGTKDDGRLYYLHTGMSSQPYQVLISLKADQEADIKRLCRIR